VKTGTVGLLFSRTRNGTLEIFGNASFRVFLQKVFIKQCPRGSAGTLTLQRSSERVYQPC
jgi:hypothetical protein